MIRLTIAILIVVSFLVAAPAAPVPTHLMPKPKYIYFPTEIGTKWVCSSEQGDYFHEIAEANLVEGGKQIIVAHGRDESRSSRNEYFVSEEGVGLLGFAPNRLAEPYWIFRNGPSDGRGWQWTSRFRIPKLIEAEGTFKAMGPEKITVPAGTFEAVRFEDKTSLRNPETSTCWFAPGVGKIREDWNGKTHEVLKSFELAGRKPALAPPPRRVGLTLNGDHG
jgi:hypothetical protein